MGKSNRRRGEAGRPFDAVADNGLLDRRALLGRGVALAGAMSAGIGATLTGANGRPVVQSGLESSSANCLRYTGSAALRSRAGFPSLCAKPVATLAGQAELVADIYQKWIVGAAPKSAQDAAVLFANSTNPGDPRVQSILRSLPTSRR